MPLAGGTFTGNVTFNDSAIAKFGTGSDLQIYHDGSNSYIQDGGTGHLIIRGEDIFIANAANSETMASFTVDGAAQLYYDNSVKLATKSDGIDVTGEVQCDSLDVDGAIDIDGGQIFYDNVGNNLHFIDNVNARFGTGSDLRIYHDGSDSYIADTGTGKLHIRGNSQLVLESNNGENYLAANENGDVHLYYDGGVRLSTKSDGVDITGELQCDSLDVDGTADFTGDLTVPAIIASSLIRSNRTTGNSPCFHARLNNTTNASILADGSATFAGPATVNRTSSSHGCFYAQLNGSTNAYIQADGSATFGGKITAQANAVAEISTLSSASTITPNFANSCNFTVTLGTNTTIANPSNLTAGQSGSIFIVQDGTGSRTAAFGSYWDFAGGAAPTLTTTANGVDRIDYIVRSSTSIHAVATLAYS